MVCLGWEEIQNYAEAWFGSILIQGDEMVCIASPIGEANRPAFWQGFTVHATLFFSRLPSGQVSRENCLPWS